MLEISFQVAAYWEPNEEVQSILSEIKPSNDACESILGLNNYLTTAIPNLHQMARSNMIQMKKNKTLKWLSTLSKDEYTSIRELEKKLHNEKERLSECRLITSSIELKKELLAIEEGSKNSKKRKVQLLKTQVNIRKKVLSEPIHNDEQIP